MARSTMLFAATQFSLELQATDLEVAPEDGDCMDPADAPESTETGGGSLFISHRAMRASNVRKGGSRPVAVASLRVVSPHRSMR